MGISVQKKETVTYSCDHCGKQEEKNTHWYVFTQSKNTGLRLFESAGEYHYESYQLPNKTKLCFCSLDCARNYLRQEVDLLLAELKPQTQRSNTKPLM